MKQPIVKRKLGSQSTTNKEDSDSEITTSKRQEIKIEILNGTGNSKLLTKITEKLKENGYNVVKTGNTKTTSKTSIINRTNKTTKDTNELKEILKVGTATKKFNNSNVDYTIILGKDYK